jgi:uncharacterized protein YciI
MHYLLFYEVADDYVSKRAKFREEHLEKAWRASDRGELLLAGALANPVDGAVLLFKGDSPEIAERFAQADPYVKSGAVKRWYVREWTTVAGDGATTPIKPKTVASPETRGEGTRTEFTSKGPTMRMWRGRASAERAGQYVQHATGTVFPKLRNVEGHRGAYLLRRAINGAVEFVVLTLWESMDAVHRFAGADAGRAVLEPEAQAILSGFDETATHFEIVHSPE